MFTKTGWLPIHRVTRIAMLIHGKLCVDCKKPDKSHNKLIYPQLD